MPERYSLTTPIYYVNSVPHIGNTLTTVAADVTARYQKMRGRQVSFLTGTDENGLKVKEAAEKAGKDSQAFVDEISQEFVRIWHGMDIRYDDFIRTTEPRHKRAVEEVWRRLKANGHIYQDTYEGWYDVSSETFYKESDLVDGKSPDGNEVRMIREDNWFFRLSAFAEPLLNHIEANPKFILPESRKNEVVSFIKGGLRDMCVSRTNQGWGIPVPDDPGKVVYVWFDALINYLAATGWPEKGYERDWPNEVEWMGKDILTRFHATLWPAMLLGIGEELPVTLVGHAWLMIGADKISKSLGNTVAPLEVANSLAKRSGCDQKIAVDAVRHYIAATMPFEGDASYTSESFDRKYNNDLANDLGNALNRTLSMAHRYIGGTVPEGEIESEAQVAIEVAKKEFEDAMSDFRVDRAADACIGLARFLNKYVDVRAPWALAKNDDPALVTVMKSMLACLRAAEGLARPIMPTVADEIAFQLGLEPTSDWSKIGLLPAGTKLGEGKPIFPRLDMKKAAAAPKPDAPRKEPIKPQPKTETAPVAEISIEDFVKIQLKVARVLEAEPVEGSDKLLKVQLMVGDERRQVVAGIRKSYEPKDLIGRQVILVSNLKPAKLRGVDSQGMLLAADDGDGAILLSPEREAPEGCKVR